MRWSRISLIFSIYIQIIIILHFIKETTLDIEYNTQAESDCKLPSCMESLLEAFTIRASKLWLHPNIVFYNTSIGKEQQKCLAYINTFTDKVIRKKKTALEINHNKESSRNDKEGEKNPKMFLDLVIELSKNEKQTLEKNIRDEVNTMTFAGSDTTTCSTSFVFLMLATFPEIQDIVYQELQQIYGSNDPFHVPVKYDDLQHMNYLERVIKETLRLFPVVPIIGRHIMEDLKVDDNVTIPKGSSTILAIFKIHRYEKYWPEPLKFDPDRFLPENIEARNPFSYIPFGAGPRNCIGAKYAIAEMKTIIATTLRKFIVTTDKPMAIKDIELKFHVTLKPVKPIMLRFKKRH